MKPHTSVEIGEFSMKIALEINKWSATAAEAIMVATYAQQMFLATNLTLFRDKNGNL